MLEHIVASMVQEMAVSVQTALDLLLIGMVVFVLALVILAARKTRSALR